MNQSRASQSPATILTLYFLFQISLLFKDKDLYDDETSDHESAVTVVPKYTLCRVVPQKSTRKEDLNDAEGSDGEFKPDGYSAEEDKMAKKPAKKLESRKVIVTETSSSVKVSDVTLVQKADFFIMLLQAKSAAMAGIELIHSETQRLLRESRLSLPYHRPKQHTITEFLQRRSVQATKELDTNSRDLSLIWYLVVAQFFFDFLISIAYSVNGLWKGDHSMIEKLHNCN